MDYRRANRAYLYMILSTLALSFMISYYILITGLEVSIFMNNFLSELIVLLPTVAVVLYSGDKLSSVIPFKIIKLKSIFLTVLYLMALFPLVSFVNYASMFFVENMVDSISNQVIDMPMGLMILSMGVIGPFVEEVVFRGIILHSYERSGRIIGSIVLSSILFGMMHLNFNQFAYGTVMGIMFCLLVEATGSVFTSFLAHGVFNTIEVIIMYASTTTIDEAETAIEEYATSNEGMLMLLGLYFVFAVIFTIVALFLLSKIADIEGRKDYVRSIPMYPRQGYKLITFPLIVAAVISFAFMIMMTYV